MVLVKNGRLDRVFGLDRSAFGQIKVNNKTGKVAIMATGTLGLFCAVYFGAPIKHILEKVTKPKTEIGKPQ